MTVTESETRRNEDMTEPIVIRQSTEAYRGRLMLIGQRAGAIA